MVHLCGCLQSEIEGISQSLTGRIQQLAERYATPLPDLTSEVDRLAKQVQKHLGNMGALGS